MMSHRSREVRRGRRDTPLKGAPAARRLGTPWPTALAAICVLGAAAGCGDRARDRASLDDLALAKPPPAQGTAARSTEEAPQCQTDAECVAPWRPDRPGCASADRCVQGQCIAPAAMTGVADATTGRVVFDTPQGERSFQVEIARDAFETQRGLMCREQMKADWGMLFIMPRREPHYFWMFNTLIPLDMFFLDEDWRVVGIAADAVPHSRSPRGVDRPSRYVLELVGGAAAEAGLKVGTQARFYPPRGI